MKKGIAVLLAVVLLVTAGGAVFAENVFLDFMLLNETGLIITEMYVSPSDEMDWGDDILDMGIIGDEEYTEVEFSEDADSAYWDIKIVDENENEWIFEDLDLTDITMLTLYRADDNVWGETIADSY